MRANSYHFRLFLLRHSVYAQARYRSRTDRSLYVRMAHRAAMALCKNQGMAGRACAMNFGQSLPPAIA
jgi:hypothetical protein